jgi:hypothetical protein
VKAGPALFVGFVLLGLLRTFPWAALTIVGVIAAIALLTWIVVALARMLERGHEARAAIIARAEQQHAWVMAGDDRGTYGSDTPADFVNQCVRPGPL